MQPPFDLNAVLFIIGAFVCLYWLRALRLAREGARLLLRNLLKAFVVFCFSMAALDATRSQTHLVPSQEQLAAGFVALVFFGQLQSRKRSRYIPKSTRRPEELQDRIYYRNGGRWSAIDLEQTDRQGRYKPPRQGCGNRPLVTPVVRCTIASEMVAGCRLQVAGCSGSIGILFIVACVCIRRRAEEWRQSLPVCLRS